MAGSELENRPAPCDVSRWQNALLSEWGRTLDGRPKVRLVWAQEERHFARGGMRIKYPTEKFIEKKTYSYHLKDLTAGQVTPVSYKEATENRDLNMLRMSYLEDHQVEWVGEARWIVEEFYGSEMWGREEEWEHNRYDYSNEREGLWLKKVFIPHIELWREDRLGPYPKGGKYDFLMRVESERGHYMQPNDSTLEKVRQIFKKREEITKGVDAQKKVTDFYKRVEEYDLIEAERMTRQITKETMKDLRPLISVPNIQ